MYTSKWHVLGTEGVTPFWQKTINIIYAIHMYLFTIVFNYLYEY